MQIFFLPILGSIADYSNLKKKLLAVFCYIGVTATCLMFFITGNLYWLGGLLFIIANLAFGAALVLYNGFLNEITTEDQRDKVSSRGFAYGYLGGGLLLALNFLLVLNAGRLGLDHSLAVRHFTSVGRALVGRFCADYFCAFEIPRCRENPAARKKLSDGGLCAN